MATIMERGKRAGKPGHCSKWHLKQRTPDNRANDRPGHFHNHT